MRSSRKKKILYSSDSVIEMNIYGTSVFCKKVDAKRTANGNKAMVKFEAVISYFCWRAMSV